MWAIINTQDHALTLKWARDMPVNPRIFSARAGAWARRRTSGRRRAFELTYSSERSGTTQSPNLPRRRQSSHLSRTPRNRGPPPRLPPRAWSRRCPRAACRRPATNKQYNRPHLLRDDHHLLLDLALEGFGVVIAKLIQPIATALISDRPARATAAPPPPRALPS